MFRSLQNCKTAALSRGQRSLARLLEWNPSQHHLKNKRRSRHQKKRPTRNRNRNQDPSQRRPLKTTKRGQTAPTPPAIARLNPRHPRSINSHCRSRSYSQVRAFPLPCNDPRRPRSLSLNLKRNPSAPSITTAEIYGPRSQAFGAPCISREMSTMRA